MTSGPSQFERALIDAIGDYQAGRLDQAVAACQRLLQRDPRNPGAHQLLAVVHLQQGNVRAARTHIGCTLAEQPDHLASLMIAGRAAHADGDLDAALRHFERAAALAPDAAEPAYLAGSTLLELGQPEALPALRRLLIRHPLHAAGWCALGHALKKAEQPDAALEAFERAIGADPGMAKAHFSRANTLHATGRLDEAIASFRRALELEPGSKEVIYNLGLSLLEAGSQDAARSALERTVVLDPSFADAWFSLGLVRQDFCDLAGAAAAFRVALELRPDYVEAAVNLGIVLQQAGGMQEALEAYRRAVELRPDTFGRIAQAITAASTGRLWLDLERLRRLLTS